MIRSLLLLALLLGATPVYADASSCQPCAQYATRAEAQQLSRTLQIYDIESSIVCVGESGPFEVDVPSAQLTRTCVVLEALAEVENADCSNVDRGSEHCGQL